MLHLLLRAYVGLRMWTFLLGSGAAVKRRTSLDMILFMSMARPGALPSLGGRLHPGTSPFYFGRLVGSLGGVVFAQNRSVFTKY